MATNRPSAGRVAAHRARLREAGLRPVSVWALPEHHSVIKDFVADLQKEGLRQDAQRPQAEPAHSPSSRKNP
jgi:hypothetical protein